jgi:predicted DNA-binding transcriptional regulator YafY
LVEQENYAKIRMVKAERLFSILTLLLNNRKSTAPYLAKRFGVSVRTIYRDIEALALAGIPVFSTTGKDGGVELVEGFTIDKQLLETGEIQRILAALDGLSGVLPGTAVSDTAEKFRLLLTQSGQKGIPIKANHIFIELSPSSRDKAVIESLEKSINENTCLQMDYSDTEAQDSRRTIEPLGLIFYWQSWYLYAFCHLRKAFRMFRISRIMNLTASPAKRISPPVDLSSRPWTRQWETESEEEIVFRAAAKAKNRIRELFDWSDIAELASGDLEIKAYLPVNEWSLSLLIGLPEGVKIIRPAKMRNMLAKRAVAISSLNQR